MKNQKFWSYSNQNDATYASCHPHFSPANSYYFPHHSYFPQENQVNLHKITFFQNDFAPQTQNEYPYKTQNFRPPLSKFTTPHSRYAPLQTSMINTNSDSDINKEDIKLWVERRKNNYPRQSKKLIKEDEKLKNDEIEEISPKLSQLEIKLRKKLKIMTSHFDKKGKIKEKYWHDLQNFIYEKDFLREQSKKISQKNHEIDLQESPDKRNLDNKKNKKFMKKKKFKLQNSEKTIENLIKENETSKEVSYKDEIIENIKLQQSDQQKELESLLDLKGNYFSHHYKINNLTRSLVLDEIYKEKTFILQGLHFLAQENIMEDKEEKNTK